MHWHTRAFWAQMGADFLAAALICAIPAGILLACYFESARWLVVSLMAFLIFMAG